MFKKIRNGSLLLFFLILSGCVKFPDDVIAPKWDVDFNIPITNKTYKLSDIIKPQKYIDVNDDSSYSFSSDVYEYSSGVSEFLDQSESSVSVEGVLIPANIETDIYLPFPDSMKLVKAVFKEGTLAFSAVNRSSLENITVDIKAPGLKDAYGNILSSQLIVAPGDSGTASLLLNEYRYTKPESQPSYLDNGIQIKTTVTSYTNSSEASVSFYSSKFIFRSITGYIPPKSLDPFSQVVELKLGNDITGYRGNIYLTDAFLRLKTKYVSASQDPFDLKLNNFQIIAHSITDNQQKPLLFKNSSDNPSSSINFQTGYIDTIFNQSNSDIADFVAFFPDEMIINTSAVMNPNDDKSYRTVTEDDQIKMESLISTKGFNLSGSGEATSAMAIRKSTLKDTLELSMSKSNRDALLDGRAADISIQVKNAIPLKTWIKIILTDQNYNELTSLTSDKNGADSLEFSGAQVNSSNGDVSGASQSEQYLNLNNEQIQYLANAYYVIVSLSLETSSFDEANPVHVLLKANDWVEVHVKGRVNYNINLNN